MNDETRCHDLSFWMLSFKPTFSLSTFIKRLFNSFVFCHKGGIICISEVIDILLEGVNNCMCSLKEKCSSILVPFYLPSLQLVIFIVVLQRKTSTNFIALPWILHAVCSFWISFPSRPHILSNSLIKREWLWLCEFSLSTLLVCSLLNNIYLEIKYLAGSYFL